MDTPLLLGTGTRKAWLVEESKRAAKPIKKDLDIMAFLVADIPWMVGGKHGQAVSGNHGGGCSAEVSSYHDEKKTSIPGSHIVGEDEDILEQAFHYSRPRLWEVVLVLLFLSCWGVLPYFSGKNLSRSTTTCIVTRIRARTCGPTISRLRRLTQT